MENTTYQHLRFLVLTRKRVFTDAIAWLGFFLLTIGFCTIYLWYKYDHGIVDSEFESFLEYVLGFSLTGQEI